MPNMPADYEVAATGNQRFSSAAFKGHPYVIYFYPKDDTPGCTREACGFRDARARLAAAGAVVLGISPDSVAEGRYRLEGRRARILEEQA